MKIMSPICKTEQLSPAGKNIISAENLVSWGACKSSPILKDNEIQQERVSVIHLVSK